MLDLVIDQDGVLWIGTPAGMDKFDPEKKTFKRYQHKPDDPATLSHGAVKGMDVAQDGSLWIGLYGGGLDRFDPLSQKFTHFMPEQGNPESLVSDWIFTVFVDASGKIWAGTEGGSSCLDPETGIFSSYATKNMVHAIYQNEQGIIWLGTNGGLMRFNQESQTLTEYNTNDGLPNDIVVSIT